MEAYIADNSAEAVKIVESILKEGESISCGGFGNTKGKRSYGLDEIR